MKNTKKALDSIVKKYAPNEIDATPWPEDAVYLLVELRKRKASYPTIAKALAELGLKKSPDTIKQKMYSL